MDLSSLLAEALNGQGYEVDEAPSLDGRSGASYPVSLIAEQEGRRLIVDILTDRPVGPQDIDALASIVDDTGLDGVILFALKNVRTGFQPHTVDHRVDVWGRDDIAQALGHAVLDRAVRADASELDPGIAERVLDGETIDLSFIKGTLEGPEPQAIPNQPDGPSSSTAASATEAPDDGSGAEFLDSGRTEQPPQTAQADALTPDEVADDGSDAELLDSGRTAEPTDPEQAPPAAANSGDEDAGETDPASSPSGFMDPDEMARKAKEMLEQGEIPDDGDAELLPSEPTQQAPSQEPAGGQNAPAGQGGPEQAQGRPPAQRDPTEPSASQTPDPTQAETPPDPEPDAPQGQDFPDGDCELLPSRPREQAANQQETPAAQTGNQPAQDRKATEPAPGQAGASSPHASEAPMASLTGETTQGASNPNSPAAAAGTDPQAQGFLSGGCIQPTIDEAEARSTAEGALFSVSEARLELLPFHVYRYRVTLRGDGRSRQQDGRVWASAQSGNVVPAPGGQLIDEPDGPFERFEGKLEPSRLKQRVHKHLANNLQVRDEVRQDYSESAIIERVNFEADPDSIQFERLGTAYAPRWRVEGQNGTVFVDAVTGDLVSA